ncbi:hypothetical protein BKA93DRAFT_572356 [Sparassis latifolia]
MPPHSCFSWLLWRCLAKKHIASLPHASLTDLHCGPLGRALSLACCGGGLQDATVYGPTCICAHLRPIRAKSLAVPFPFRPCASVSPFTVPRRCDYSSRQVQSSLRRTRTSVARSKACFAQPGGRRFSIRSLRAIRSIVALQADRAALFRVYECEHHFYSGAGNKVRAFAVRETGLDDRARRPRGQRAAH